MTARDYLLMNVRRKIEELDLPLNDDAISFAISRINCKKSTDAWAKICKSPRATTRFLNEVKNENT